MAEGSKPPSVRPGIRLCVHTVSGLPVVWTCTGEDSPFHPFSAVRSRLPEAQSAPSPFTQYAVASDRAVLGGFTPRSLFGPGVRYLVPHTGAFFGSGSRARGLGDGVAVSVEAVKPPRFPRAPGYTPAPHRSGGVVSFLFQSQRSPAPGLRPVACPDGGGTFLITHADSAGHGSQAPSANRTSVSDD